MRALVLVAVVGALAQLVDGSLGMAYGVTSSTLLLATGVAPAAASAAVHFSEMGTTLVSGFAHTKLGNVDWRTVSIVAVPGGIGAFAGATLLSSIDGDLAKPWVAALLLGLGGYVVWRFLRLGGRRPQFRGRPSVGFLLPLGLVAGAMDAVGGGGWGPVGTTSLLSSGRLEPRKVVGSVDTAEFVVAIGGSLGFLTALGAQGIDFGLATALLAGGVLAAPFAAWLVKHLPAQVLGVGAGGLIVLTNTDTIGAALGVPPGGRLAAVGVVAVGWAAAVVWAVRQEQAARSARIAPCASPPSPTTHSVR
ncbi:MAG TPA: sulfite exporter TauE/SafE family protein [Nocardioidaceae bacterium]|nr:sulfite exporter TauE/SafE family protein [Nocardioidaceae bacterium]